MENKLDREILLEQFNKILDKAEELRETKEYKEFVWKERQIMNLCQKEQYKILGPYLLALRHLVAGYPDCLALKIAIAGENWVSDTTL